MGAIGGLLGLSGGVNGTGMPEPAAAAINNPVSMAQLSQSQQANQAALGQQQGLLAALQGQNGIQNQSDVYGQFQDVAAGRGPNPAQAMLSQATGQNVANQAALMAGQRGASSNVGMMARQAAQQGGNIQQQAAGQGATMQAQQSLNALNSAGSMANTQVANQIGATNANTAAQQNNQSQLMGTNDTTNRIAAAQQGNINNVYGQLSNTQMQGQQGMIGGIMKAMGSGASMMGGGGGGMPMGGAEGGDVSGANIQAPAAQPAAPVAAAQPPTFSQFLNKKKGKPGASAATESTPAFGSGGGPKALYEGAAALGEGAMNAMKGASKMPSIPMSDNTSSSQIQNMPVVPAAQGGDMHDYRSGGKVNAKGKNQKAVSKGNSYANDKIPAVLSEHEIVLPRTVTLSADPVGASAKFVAAVMAKRRAKR